MQDKNVSLGFTWPRPAVEDDPPGHLSEKENMPLGLEEDAVLGFEENVPLLEKDMLPGRNETTALGLEETRGLEEALWLLTDLFQSYLMTTSLVLPLTMNFLLRRHRGPEARTAE